MTTPAFPSGTILGYPRIGRRRELKRAVESFWAGRIDSAELPSSRVRGGGALRWPRDTVLYDFTLDADRMALEDLRWISPDFPDWRGHAHVGALSEGGSRNTFRLTNLSMGDGTASANGVLTVVTDEKRGLGVTPGSNVAGSW